MAYLMPKIMNIIYSDDERDDACLHRRQPPSVVSASVPHKVRAAHAAAKIPASARYKLSGVRGSSWLLPRDIAIYAYTVALK